MSAAAAADTADNASGGAAGGGAAGGGAPARTAAAATATDAAAATATATATAAAAAVAAAAAAATVVAPAWLARGTKEDCPVEGCEVACSSKQQLVFHLRSHTPAETAGVALPPSALDGEPPEGPFHCEHADCKFGVGKQTLKTLASLRKHDKSMHRESRYRCPTCGKGFVEQWRMNVHAKGHTASMACLCGWTGKSASSLRDHIKSWASTPDGHKHGMPPPEPVRPHPAPALVALSRGG
jgi:hypothetical protein